MSLTARAELSVSPSRKEFSFWLIGISLLLINLTSDHILIHSNLLKLCVLSFVIFAWSCFLFWNNKSSDEPSLTVKNLCLFLLPLIGILPGTLLNQAWTAHHEQVSAATQITCMIFGFLVYQVVVSNQLSKKLLWPVLLTVIYVVSVALTEAFGFDPMHRLYLNPFDTLQKNLAPSYSGAKMNISSSFGNPNYFACWVVLTLPLVTALIFANKPKTLVFQLVCVAAVFGLLACLFLTTSRGALFAFLCSTVPAIFYFIGSPQSNKYRRLFLIVVIGFLLVVLFLAASSQMFSRIAALGEEQAWLSRYVPWEAAISSASENLWFGSGFGASYTGFFGAADPLRELYGIQATYRHAHNEILEVLQEGGMFGLSAYIAFWAYVFRAGYKVVFVSGKRHVNSYIALGALCGLVGYHMHGLVTVATQMVAPRSMAYVLAGILIALYHGRLTHSERKAPYSPLWVAGTMTMLSILLCMLAYNAACSHWLLKKYTTSPEAVIYAKSRNVYYLSAISNDLAVEESRRNVLLTVANQLHEVIPFYRDALLHQALVYFTLGDMFRSKQLIRESQLHNLYSRRVIGLGISLSIVSDDKGLFEKQFKMLLTRSICTSIRNLNCRRNKPIVVTQAHSQALTVSEKRGGYEILVHPAFFEFVTNLMSNSEELSEDEKVKLFGSQLSKVVDPKYFFLKELKEKPELAIRISKFLALKKKYSQLATEFRQKINAISNDTLWEQVVAYYDAKSEIDEASSALYTELAALKKEINSHLDFDAFMQRRNLMTDITRQLLSVSSYYSQRPSKTWNNPG
jgi:O-antigen ligase